MTLVTLTGRITAVGGENLFNNIVRTRKDLFEVCELEPMTFRGINFTMTYDDTVITVPIDQSLQRSSYIQDFVKRIVPSADLPDTAVTEKETEENQLQFQQSTEITRVDTASIGAFLSYAKGLGYGTKTGGEIDAMSFPELMEYVRETNERLEKIRLYMSLYELDFNDKDEFEAADAIGTDELISLIAKRQTVL